MSNGRIYISGPITGTNNSFQRFSMAVDVLEDMGWDSIVNPAYVNTGMPGDMTHEEYMVMSMAMLSLCDSIYMLRDWEYSKGARMEFAYAVENNFKIFFQE